MKKKVFVSIRSDEARNLIKMALEKVVELTQQIVDDPEEADLIVVNSATDALSMLKEYEAVVLVAVMVNMKHEETGARSLQKAYPKRVLIGQMLEFNMQPGDVPLVPYIMGFIEEQKEEVK